MSNGERSPARRQGRREGTVGEDNQAVAGTQAVGGGAIGRNEGAIGLDYGEAHGLARGVDEGCGRALGSHWSLVWVLALHSRYSTWLAPFADEAAALGLDLGDQLSGARTAGLLWQVLPARKR